MISAHKSVQRLSRRRKAALAAARSGLGTPFRAQGRTPGVGLDCIGVALLAATGAGVSLGRVPAYALTGDHADLMAATMESLGCRRLKQGRPGDLIAFELARGHRHLAVLTETGMIHAHAGLGRVVEAPVPTDWPVAAIWALPGVR
jgi:murein DD-endopeptidase / murein LD-carboxypeptidase